MLDRSQANLKPTLPQPDHNILTSTAPNEHGGVGGEFGVLGMGGGSLRNCKNMNLRPTHGCEFIYVVQKWQANIYVARSKHLRGLTQSQRCLTDMPPGVAATEALTWSIGNCEIHRIGGRTWPAAPPSGLPTPRTQDLTPAPPTQDLPTQQEPHVTPTPPKTSLHPMSQGRGSP